jgi:hypothetical protein
VEQLPHGDATRHVLVSRLLTITFTKLHCCITFTTKYPCVLMRNPQRVDGVVLFQSNRVRMKRKATGTVSPRVVCSD